MVFGGMNARTVPVCPEKYPFAFNGLSAGPAWQKPSLGRFFRAKIAFGHIDLGLGASYFAG